MTIVKNFVSYEEVHALVRSAASRISQTFSPDYIVAISGGGLIPARILRTYIKVPILSIGLSLYDEHDKQLNTIRKTQWFDNDKCLVGKNVLIVDEVDDTRKTLSYAVEEVIKMSPAQVGVLVLHNKKKEKASQIHASAHYFAASDVDDHWIVYPWDAVDIESHTAKANARTVQSMLQATNS